MVSKNFDGIESIVVIFDNLLSISIFYYSVDELASSTESLFMIEMSSLLYLLKLERLKADKPNFYDSTVLSMIIR